MMRTVRPISSIILSILLFFFFISPQYDEVKDIRSDTDDYRVATERYGEFSATLNRMLDLKRGVNPSTIERLNQFVPESIDNAHIIADIEQMAKNNNMLFGNISSATSEANFGREKQNSNNNSQGAMLITAATSFDVIGTYEQFKNFITELESSLTLMEVTNISLAASGGFFEQFSVTVTSYALKQGKQ